VRATLKVNNDDIVVVFDGYCVMCSNFVSWLAKHDTQNKIFFTTFESNFLNKKYPDIKLADTVFVIDYNAKTYIKSQAIKVCLEKLKHKKLFVILIKMVPLKFSNLIYSAVAKTRYVFFGKKDMCTIPNDIVKSRILT
jgi:predicted DCC family thiol-disulfide oxidoreductase YuxK